MASGAKDIQFRELKDIISQLNMTIRTQNDLIISLQKMLEERNAQDDEKDRIISNLQAQLEYFKQTLFAMKRYGQNSVIPGQNWSVSCTLPPLMGVQPVKTRRIRGS